MKLYIFSSVNDKISREEKEVVEKNKIFVEKTGLTERHYPKNMLDIPETSFSSVSMISLNGRVDHFVKKVIEAKEKEIDKLEKQLVQKKNNLIKIKMDYAGVLEERVENGIYNAVSYIEFIHDGDMVVANRECFKTKMPNRYPIYNIVSGDHFLTMMENHPFKNVFKIFVNGNATNLALEGFEHGADGECVISLEKLKKMNEKTKLEIDCI